MRKKPKKMSLATMEWHRDHLLMNADMSGEHRLEILSHVDYQQLEIDRLTKELADAKELLGWCHDDLVLLSSVIDTDDLEWANGLASNRAGEIDLFFLEEE